AAHLRRAPVRRGRGAGADRRQVDDGLAARFTVRLRRPRVPQPRLHAPGSRGRPPASLAWTPRLPPALCRLLRRALRFVGRYGLADAPRSLRRADPPAARAAVSPGRALRVVARPGDVRHASARACGGHTGSAPHRPPGAAPYGGRRESCMAARGPRGCCVGPFPSPPRGGELSVTPAAASRPPR